MAEILKNSFDLSSKNTSNLQLAVTYDQHNIGMYIDGDLAYSQQVTGTIINYESIMEETIYYLSGDWWPSAINISTFQYFSNERLSASRLTELQVRLTGLL